MRRLGVLLPLIAALVLAAGVARADASSDAEALISRGLELREKGKDDEALTLFRQAEQKAPSPRARAQVALAEQALGMWVPAETDLTAAMAERDPWITKNRAPLEGALTVIRKHIASLEVRGAEKADVYIDGRRLGSGPGPYRVEAGRRTLEVRAKGYQPTSRAVELPAGGTARESVDLVLLPVTPVVARPDPEPRPAPVDPGRGQRLLGWVFVGAGAALLATGAAAMIVRENAIADYNRSACPGTGVDQTPDCQDRLDRPQTWLTVGIVSLVAGGAAAIGGGIIVGTAPKSSSSATISCGPFGCAGTF